MLLYTRNDPRFHDRRLFKGGSSSSTDTTTQNVDKRVAVQDGFGLSGDGNSLTVTGVDPDAVKAMTQAGVDTIKASGAAVVELYENAGSTTAASWDKTVSAGAALIDKLIDKSTEVGTAAVSSFQPNENKTADTMKWVGIAAAVAFAATQIKGKKA
jgi:hypothetical protein